MSSLAEMIDAAADRAIAETFFGNRHPELIPAIREVLFAADAYLKAVDEANGLELSRWPKSSPDERDRFESALVRLGVASSLEMLAETLA